MKTIVNSLLISGIIFLLCCTRNKEMIGPELGNLSIVEPLSADKSTVNFSEGETVTFSAIFLSKVNWVLQIKGHSTHITRTFSGTGTRVDVTNALWKGEADHPSFKEETVTAILRFPDYPADSSLVTLLITGTKNITTPGILVNDFESGITGFTTYGEPGEVMSNTIDSDPALGGKYYNLTGVDLNGNFFIGIGGFPASASYAPAIHYPVPHVALDEVYFNCYVYGSGDPSTQVSFDFQEDDEEDANPGVYDDAGDDTWSKGFIVDWKGWKLVSFRMSETTRSTQASFGGSGNGIQEIHRILKVQVVLLSIDNTTRPVKAIIDYPVFTIGGPFIY